MHHFRIIFSIIFTSILLLVPISLYASGVKEYRLDNGLKVLIIEEHKAPVATFQVWYRVGSRNEPMGKSVLSHLLEHMMFKGTPHYGSKAFSRIVQKTEEWIMHIQQKIIRCISRFFPQTG